jgi:hypothetical protein
VYDSYSVQEGQPEDNRPAKDWILPKETELRVEVGNENVVDIRVHNINFVVTGIKAN